MTVIDFFNGCEMGGHEEKKLLIYLPKFSLKNKHYNIS
jgi:hypothetical protein